MVSDVSICNLALTKIGTNTITSLTEKTETARRCNIIYTQCRDTVLRSHTWSFATKIELLAELANETVINYDYLYVYPANCLFIVKIFNESNTDVNNYKPLLSSAPNTKIIATNVYQAYIEYIERIEDPTLFDDSFIKAFVARLAYELSPSLKGNSGTEYLQEYDFLMKQAKRINSQEKNVKLSRTSKYVEVR